MRAVVRGAAGARVSRSSAVRIGGHAAPLSVNWPGCPLRHGGFWYVTEPL
jgi:hypothetical protein